MKESLYLNGNLALINYTKSYYSSSEELLSSEPFEQFLEMFLLNYQKKSVKNYIWLSQGLPVSEVKKEMIRLLKVLMVLDIDEIFHPLLNEKAKLLHAVEEAYTFWRNKQRISIISTNDEEGLQLANFIDADNNFNQMILSFYRSIQQKIQGSKNRVYRQLQAGTNAAILLTEYSRKLPVEYSQLENIPFINRVLLRTPLLIHPKFNKRVGTFTETKTNPIKDFVKGNREWMCYPCKVGSLLVFIYFHRDFTSSAIALANLFELASAKECIGHRPDCIVLFGNPDGTDETTFYHDQANNIWVGKVSYNEKIEYFGYLKKMTLTLHNLSMMEKGWLPLHGAMINITLKNGVQKGIVMIGDSGAGKSESIEALSNFAEDEIIDREIVFDDMGSLHLENGKIVAQGTEIGAFVRLDDLEAGSAYRDLDRSIFFNPETANARVVVPAATYEVITKSHPVDFFLYANNYTDERGLVELTNHAEAKEIFIEGKRFALGTTQESGLSTTFFANPFGPMQKEEKCRSIIDEMFGEFKAQNIFVGEIYTCLGVEGKKDEGLKEVAESLLQLIKK